MKFNNWVYYVESVVYTHNYHGQCSYRVDIQYDTEATVTILLTYQGYRQLRLLSNYWHLSQLPIPTGLPCPTM